MLKLKEYLLAKQLEEDQERKINCRHAIEDMIIQQRTCTYNYKMSPTLIAINQYIESFGYNPFDEKYKNLSAIEQIDQLSQLKFERILQNCIEVDQILLQVFESPRCHTINEDDEEEESEEQNSFGFDCSKGIQIQKELQSIKGGNKKLSVRYKAESQFPSYKQQYLHTSTKKSQKSQETIKKEQEILYSDNFQFQFQYDEEQDYEEISENDNHQTSAFEQEQEDLPQFGSCDSANFKQSLQQQLAFYQNEIRQSMSNRGLTESYQESHYSTRREVQKNEEINQNKSTPKQYQQKLKPQIKQLQPQKIQQCNLQSVQLQQQQSFSESEENEEQNNFNFNQSPDNISNQSPKKIKPKRKVNQPSQVSLLGSLFTQTVLKDMEILNDEIIPQAEVTVPVQYEEITIEKAFIQEQSKKTIENDQKNINLQSYSPLKMQIIDDIRTILDINQNQMIEQFNEYRTNSINLSYQQLSARTSQIFDFIIDIGKELQSKGSLLSKQTILKINQSYKELGHVLLKRNPIILPKMNANQIVFQMFAKVTEFLTPQYFQSQFKLSEQTGNQQLLVIFSPLVVALAITDKDFPFVNTKIPQITWRLIEQLFQNSICLKLRSIPKQLVQTKIKKRYFIEYGETFNNLELLVNSGESGQFLKNLELYQLIKLSYAIQQCFEFMENLVFEEEGLLNLNDNRKYERNWKKLGTRYTSKKSKENTLQEYNKQLFDKFGVDFQAWQLNLQLQENEMKKIKKIENEQMWKERRQEKQQQQLMIQKENQEQLFENEYQFKLNQEIKEKAKLKKINDFRERQKEKTLSYKQEKELNKQVQNEVRESQSQLIRHNSEMTISQQSLLKQDKNQQNKGRQDKMMINKLQKQEQMQQQQKMEEEERIWNKAQELLAKQKQLLLQKQQILNQMKKN